jgi:prepilin-type N-terminal cleavage/methylation domain-containing protein
MQKTNRSGFTLVELLLVILIVAVLAALLYPVMASARKEARMSRCTANLREMGMAYSMYASDYGEAPNPLQWVRAVDDSRLLSCPEDDRPDRTISSYTFRSVLPPDFKPYWEKGELDPNTVLTICNRHLEQQMREEGGARTLSEPRYRYKLVLRAGGNVGRVAYDQVREILVPGDRPTYARVYPGERFYQEARR